MCVTFPCAHFSIFFLWLRFPCCSRGIDVPSFLRALPGGLVRSCPVQSGLVRFGPVLFGPIQPVSSSPVRSSPVRSDPVLGLVRSGLKIWQSGRPLRSQQVGSMDSRPCNYCNHAAARRRSSCWSGRLFLNVEVTRCLSCSATVPPGETVPTWSIWEDSTAVRIHFGSSYIRSVCGDPVSANEHE